MSDYNIPKWIVEYQHTSTCMHFMKAHWVSRWQWPLSLEYFRIHWKRKVDLFWNCVLAQNYTILWLTLNKQFHLLHFEQP